jgi:hypothetical protein
MSNTGSHDRHPEGMLDDASGEHSQMKTSMRSHKGRLAYKAFVCALGIRRLRIWGR